MADDTTIVITDIRKALATADMEAKQKPAALLVVGGELNGTIFDLDKNIVVVGRSAENQISLEFHGISRQHFKLTATDDSFTIRDAGSRNGTFLNNKKLEGEKELKKGDIIKIGKLALKFIPCGDPERLTYDKLQHAANTDGLTGCFTKTYFNNAQDNHVKKSKLTGKPLSLILMDIDHFKNLNDSFGHDAGDFVLKEMAGLIREHGVRENDIFARYGGEEFVILLPLTNLKQAFDIAERIRKLIDKHKFIYDNKELPVAISIGIADYRKGVNNGVDLFKRADTALYKSKECGRNQVNFFRE